MQKINKCQKNCIENHKKHNEKCVNYANGCFESCDDKCEFCGCKLDKKIDNTKKNC